MTLGNRVSSGSFLVKLEMFVSDPLDIIPSGQRWATARLVRKGLLFREVQVMTQEGEFLVTYDGRGAGYESVSINQCLAQRQSSMAWFAPEFFFTLGMSQAMLKVKVWPWLGFRSFKLWIDGECVYGEGWE